MGNAGQRGEKKEQEDVRARKRVEEVVPQHIQRWAAAGGLRLSDQFREDVTEALHAFMRAHLATPSRWRWSTARKEYSRLAEDYAAIAKLLGPGKGVMPPLTFDPRFSALPPLWPDPSLLRAVCLNQFRTALAPFGDAAFLRGSLGRHADTRSCALMREAVHRRSLSMRSGAG